MFWKQERRFAPAAMYRVPNTWLRTSFPHILSSSNVSTLDIVERKALSSFTRQWTGKGQTTRHALHTLLNGSKSSFEITFTRYITSLSVVTLYRYAGKSSQLFFIVLVDTPINDGWYNRRCDWCHCFGSVEVWSYHVRCRLR